MPFESWISWNCKKSKRICLDSLFSIYLTNFSTFLFKYFEYSQRFGIDVTQICQTMAILQIPLILQMDLISVENEWSFVSSPNQLKFPNGKLTLCEVKFFFSGAYFTDTETARTFEKMRIFHFENIRPQCLWNRGITPMWLLCISSCAKHLYRKFRWSNILNFQWKALF